MSMPARRSRHWQSRRREDPRSLRILTLENRINQFSMVFGVSGPGSGARAA